MANPRLGFGIQIACAAMHWPECLDLVQAADELGYYSVGVPDHFVATPDGADPNPRLPLAEPWTALGAFAQATRNVRLGPLVASNTFRPPAVLAKMAASLDHISGGRVDLGLGIGWFDLEHTSLGFPFDPTPDRLRALDESIQILRALWTESEVSFAGEFYTLANAISEPKPLQDPLPLLLATGGPKVGLRLAARYADHWNMYRTASDWADLNRQLDDHCARENRDPTQIVRSAMIPLYLEETESIAQKIAMWGDREWFLTGTDEEIRDRIGRFVEAGADLIVLQVEAPRGNAEHLREFARRFF